MPVDAERLRLDPALVARFRADFEQLSIAGWSSPVIVAVSGGADSLALLLLAAVVLPHRVVAATVDHRLRDGSDDEAAMVARACAGLGVPHHTLTGDLPDTVSGSANLSQRARALRYALLGRLAADVGAGAIATAHQADDQLETVIMRLNRGAGLSGLAGIRTEQPGIVRPLLGWRRADLAALVAAAGLQAVADPSNSDDRFDRARLRRHLAGADWLDARAAAASAAHLGEAEQALDWVTDKLADDYASFDQDEARLCAVDLPRDLQRRFVLRCLRHLRPDAVIRGEALSRLVATLSDEGTMTLADVRCDVAWVALPEGDECPLWRFRLAPPRRSL